MPIRIFDIAKDLGVENATVLAKAKELGIRAAKVPSSSLDRITADYLIEMVKESLSAISDIPQSTNLQIHDQGDNSSPPVTSASQLKVQPSITIKLKGGDFLEKALVGELQFFLEIAATDDAPPLKLKLFPDDSQKLSLPKAHFEPPSRAELDKRTKDLFRSAYYSARRKSSDDWVNLAAFGNALKDAEPTFTAESYGERNLGSLLRRMMDVFDMRVDELNPIVYYVRIKSDSVGNPPNLRPMQTTVGKELPFGGASLLAAIPKLKTGKIHNLKLGFGFIAPDDGSENPFFHATDVVGSTIFDLRPGDPVEYEPGVNERGLCARKVRKLTSAMEV